MCTITTICNHPNVFHFIFLFFPLIYFSFFPKRERERERKKDGKQKGKKPLVGTRAAGVGDRVGSRVPGAGGIRGGGGLPGGRSLYKGQPVVGKGRLN